MAKTTLFGFKLKYIVNGNTVTCHLVHPDTGDINDKGCWQWIATKTLNTVFGDIQNYNGLDWCEVLDGESITKEINRFTKRYGKAVCNKDDVFDLEIGKRIACDNLYERLIRFRSQLVWKVFDTYYDKIHDAMCRAVARGIEYPITNRYNTVKNDD